MTYKKKTDREFTEEHKKRLSMAKKGKCNGEKNNFYGKKHSKKTKRKISLANKGHKAWNKEMKGIHLSPKSEFKNGKEHTNYGKSHSKETREKISKANSGKVFSEEHKKKIGLAHKGKILSKKHRKIISENNKGERNPNFKNWASREPYGKEFSQILKEKIRKKYGYRCQQCFRHQDELFRKLKKGGFQNYKLFIHHIDYNKQNNSEDNLIPLCNNCHCQTNFNREDWTNYFKEKNE